MLGSAQGEFRYSRTWPFTITSRPGSGAMIMSGRISDNQVMAVRRALWTELSSPACSPFSGGEHCRGVSLSELSYTLLLAKELQILSDRDWNTLNELHERAGGMTWLLYKSLLLKKSVHDSPL